MVDNEDFLIKTLQEKGSTNLNDIFLRYLEDKERKQQEALVPKDVMMPQELLNKPTSMEDVVGTPPLQNNHQPQQQQKSQ